MKIIKRLIVGILCCMLLMPTVILASAPKPEDWGDVDIANSAEVPDGMAGEEVTITIPLINRGSLRASNVIVSPLRSGDVSTYPFVTRNINEYVSYGDIEAGQMAEQSMTFSVRQDALDKHYKLTFRIEYYLEHQKVSLNKEVIIYIRGLEVTSTPDAEPIPDEESIPAPEPALIIEPVIDLDPEPIVGNVGQGSGEPISEDKKSAIPRVIVEGFRTEPKVVNAGSSFKLILEVRNTSKKMAVSNMEINLQATAPSESSVGEGGAAPSDAFLPNKGSNTLYVDSIATNSTKEVTIELTARTDLQQRPYSVAVAMKYEDKQAKEYQATSDISIPIKQEARFELSKVEIMPEFVEIGGESNVIFSIYNLGRTKLYNVKVEMVSDTVTGEAFVGNLEAGATGDVDMMVMGSAETTDDGTVKILVSYEDQDGNHNSYEDSCVIHVMPMMDEGDLIFEEGMMIDGEENGGLNYLVIAGITVGVVAVITVVIIVVVKHKRKKEEEFADEFLGSDKDERQ